MTEDQIEPLCQKLVKAATRDKGIRQTSEQRDAQSNEVVAISLELLSGFLIDINRIAWFMQQAYEADENGRRR